MEVEDEPKGVAKNLRAKSAHTARPPLVLAFQEHDCRKMEFSQRNLRERGRVGRGEAGGRRCRSKGAGDGKEFTYDRKSSNSI